MNAALYARVSSEKQDVDLSISAQLKSLREYATRNNYTVVREFVDEAETGRTSSRPSFREMISFARRPNKPFDVILVWKYSRFARSREDSILYKAMLKKAGVQVISISEPFDDSPTGRLMEAIIESLDEFYSDNLGEDVTRGMRESASRGFYLSARPPYGYQKIKVRDGNKERTKLEINPAEVNIVTGMFQDIIEGKGLIDIVRELNKRGVPGPRGKGWGKTGVYKILTNEIHTGTFVWGKNSKRGLEPVRGENACPAIVDKETFTIVQELMKERMPARIHPRRTSSTFLLSSLAYCGYCGKALIARYAKSGKFSYYVCGTLDKKGAGSCQAKYLRAEKFENLVIDQIKKHVLTPENLTQLVKIVNRELDSNMQSYEAELDVISRAVNDTNKRLGRLYDAIETGKISLEDLVGRIRELRQQLEQLQAKKMEVEINMSDKRVELVDLDTVTAYVSEMQEILNESSLTERRAFVRSFVNKIQVTGNEALMTYSLPIPPDNVTLSKGLVPRIVHHGGR